MTTKRLAITWLGHGTFLLRSPGGRRILIDPWLADNPSCPESQKRQDAVDLILVTHGHVDHVEDVVPVARATGASVVAGVELGSWLEQKGLQNVVRMNKGGTIELAGIRITMVTAVHSSSYVADGRILYLGEPAGYVLTFEDGLTVYFAGDTALFGDMRLIREMHAPAIAFLPIGDRFTMGPDAAARACELLGVRQVVPMHYGTFPALTGRPERLKELVAPLGIEVLELTPGETTI
jgi:L-ascorbate metabolism protein UlaG (beta-lactamase superfamily)